MYKVKFVKTAGHEAAELAGHPRSSAHLHEGHGGHGVMTGIGVGTAASVGSYQINRKLAVHQGDTPPPVSATTGGMPNGAGPTVSHVTSKTTKKFRRKRKGGK